ncbi:MAG: ATP-binding protein [Oscillospiraceae bacterium]|nr:ATP-binding protein [Oscillospiraceae bacterium]
MYIGNKNYIDISSSKFSDFIETGNLYVDKTAFIEHVSNDRSKVLLFTRPRRTGKSLNMDTLATFLDCKQNTARLFNGLYVESSPVFSQINKHPVIYLSFRKLRVPDYKEQFKFMIKDGASYYLHKEEIDYKLAGYFDDKKNYDTNALMYLTQNLHAVCGEKPYIFIDEYDKILMDNVYSGEYENIRRWITEVFESALKDNASLEKGILTGVTRVSKESMFSGLNNLAVYDVFTTSVYDRDFSLTEDEAQELLTPEELSEVRDWYNNTRVGKERLFNIYSVMSYLYYGKLDNYWAKSGTLDMLINLMNKSRADGLLEMIENRNAFVITELQPRLSLKNIVSNLSDSQFYSLAIQAGYLTYDMETEAGAGSSPTHRVYIPNLELRSVWREFILEFVVEAPGDDFRSIFSNIGDTEEFSSQLKDFIDYRLSYYDTDKNEPERIYHVFLFGMTLAAKYKSTSNKESGFGRYDLLIEGNAFNAVLEFKKAADESELGKKAEEALRQIDKKKYYAGIKNSKPIYKVGIACYKTVCMVKTILHEI